MHTLTGSSAPSLPPGFSYQSDRLTIEGIALDTLATQYGTPLFIYSRAAMHDSIAP